MEWSVFEPRAYRKHISRKGNISDFQFRSIKFRISNYTPWRYTTLVSQPYKFMCGIELRITSNFLSSIILPTQLFGTYVRLAKIHDISPSTLNSREDSVTFDWSCGRNFCRTFTVSITKWFICLESYYPFKDSEGGAIEMAMRSWRPLKN